MVLTAKDGAVVKHDAVGHAVRHGRYGQKVAELTPDQRTPMYPHAIFDLASVSKLYTAVIIRQLADAGLLTIPAFAASGKQDVTVKQLLAHTSGMPPSLPMDHPAPWKNG